MNKPRQLTRLKELDGIKGIIIFFIIFVHYYNRMVVGEFPIKNMPDIFVKNGWLFVEMFFIISGFLFAMVQKERSQDVSFGSFIKRRIERLYIPALFATLCDVIIRLINTIYTGRDFGLSIQRVIKTLTFSDTLVFNEQPFPSVLWYLHVLFLCYFLFFFIMKRKGYTWWIGRLFLFYLGWYISQANISFPFLYQNIGRGVFAFSIGTFLYDFQNGIQQTKRQRVSIGLLILCVALIIFDNLSSDVKVIPRETDELRLCLTVLFFPTITLAALNIRWISHFLKLKPFVFLGNISMGTFLIHVPALNLFQTLINPSYGLCYDPDGLFRFDTLLGFVVILTSIIIISIIWHYYIEKRLCPRIVQYFTTDISLSMGEEKS